MPFVSGGSGSGSGATILKKVTSKQVLNTVVETDLLNGEITLPALNATGIATIDLWGDWIQNTGGNAGQPVWKLKLGGTTLIATKTTFNTVSSALRFGWSFRAIIAGANATNAQTVSFVGSLTSKCAAATANADDTFLTGEGVQTGVLGANGNAVQIFQGYNSATVDETQAQALVFTTTNASSTATYDVTLKGALISVV